MRTAIVVCLVLMTVACSQSDETPCPDGTHQFTEYQLFMGRSGPEGEIVDDAAWDTFLADTVTPRFPDGLTVLDGRGQWRGTDGLIKKERSKLLVILVSPADDKTRLIDEISDEDKRRFSQESVLQVVENTCVSFR